MDKVYVYMWLHTASINPTAGNKTKVFSSPFQISTSSRLILAETFWNGHVAACSTALRSVTQENGSGGYVTAPCPSKVTQHSSTAGRLIF